MPVFCLCLVDVVGAGEDEVGAYQASRAHYWEVFSSAVDQPHCAKGIDFRVMDLEWSFLVEALAVGCSSSNDGLFFFLLRFG